MTDNLRPPDQEGKRAWPYARPRPFHLHGDTLAGVAILIFCAIVFALTLTFDDVPSALSHGVPPTQFPRLLVGFIAALTLLMMFEGRKKPPSDRKPVPRMVYPSTALLLVFVALINWVGTMVAMIGLCIALPLLWGERRYVPILLLAALFPIAVYYLFSEVMEVRFPASVFTKLFE